MANECQACHAKLQIQLYEFLGYVLEPLLQLLAALPLLLPHHQTKLHDELWVWPLPNKNPLERFFIFGCDLILVDEFDCFHAKPLAITESASDMLKILPVLKLD